MGKTEIKGKREKSLPRQRLKLASLPRQTQAFQSTDQAEAQTQAFQPAVQKVGEPELASADQRGDSVDELVAALSEEEQEEEQDEEEQTQVQDTVDTSEAARAKTPTLMPTPARF